MVNFEYELAVTISNVKSFISNSDVLFSMNFKKPINVIVGANGSGKSNLLYSIYHSFDKQQLMDTATDSTKEFSLFLHEGEDIDKDTTIVDEKESKNLPKFEIKEFLTEKKKSGNIGIRINETQLDETKETILGSKNLLDAELVFNKSDKIPTHSLEFDKSLDFFDLFLLDSGTYEAFNRRLMKKISKLSKKFRGVRASTEFNNGITSEVSQFVPEIKDFDFAECYVKDSYVNEFIDLSCISSGIQKSIIVQYLSYLKYLKETEKLKKFFNVLLIDEIENGLQLSRQKELPNVIKSMIIDHGLRNNIWMILTTHSPVIYSSFSKIKRTEPDLIDIFYIFRDQYGSSDLINMDDVVYIENGSTDNKNVEKAIEMEIGLSIFDLPKVMIFVEGFDKYFLDGVLDNISNKDEFKIHICKGPLQNQIWEFIERNLLSSTKKVVLFFDEDGKDMIEERVAKIKNPINDIHRIYFEPIELEPFLFGKAEDEPEERANIEKVLDKLINKIPENETHEQERTIVEGVKRDLDPNKINYEKIKSMKDLYFILGKYWKSILDEKGKNIIDDFLKVLK